MKYWILRGNKTLKGHLINRVSSLVPGEEKRIKVRPSRAEILSRVNRKTTIVRKKAGGPWYKGDVKKKVWKKIPRFRGKSVASFKDTPYFLVDAQKNIDVRPTKAEASLAAARIETAGGHAAGWGKNQISFNRVRSCARRRCRSIGVRRRNTKAGSSTRNRRYSKISGVA